MFRARGTARRHGRSAAALPASLDARLDSPVLMQFSDLYASPDEARAEGSAESMGRVQGKVAFITGAGMGQGRSHAIKLAQEGADIVAVDLGEPSYHPRVRYRHATPEDLKETARLVEETGQRCLTVHADVRRSDQMHAAVAAALGEFGRIDIVVANAGVITFHEKSWEIPEDVYDFVVDVNQKGVWNTIVATAPPMIEAGVGGSIIVTSSAAGIRGQMLYAHYVASKHAVVGLMKAFANELAPHRIRVNTVHPTGVSSPGMGSGENPEANDAIPLFMANSMAMLDGVNMLPDLDSDPATSHAPVPSLKEIEISHAVLFLASEEARYITGLQMTVDAGNTNKP
jgi:SDR family mycofactocin-dependent oxidoreductase